MRTYIDHYGTLNVSPRASAEDIVTAYRTLAPRLHPDLNPRDPNAKYKFQNLDAAYTVVGDRDKRAAYDIEYNTWAHVYFRTKQAVRADFRSLMQRFHRGGQDMTAPIAPSLPDDGGVTYGWGPDGKIVVFKNKAGEPGSTINLQA